MPIFSLGIVLNTMLPFFSGLSYCERILQASSSLDRRSYFSCQGCWLGSQGACVSKINYFQGCSEEALFSPAEWCSTDCIVLDWFELASDWSKIPHLRFDWLKSLIRGITYICSFPSERVFSCYSDLFITNASNMNLSLNLLPFQRQFGLYYYKPSKLLHEELSKLIWTLQSFFSLINHVKLVRNVIVSK